jgi:hypothetical protein
VAKNQGNDRQCDIAYLGGKGTGSVDCVKPGDAVASGNIWKLGMRGSESTGMAALPACPLNFIRFARSSRSHTNPATAILAQGVEGMVVRTRSR